MHQTISKYIFWVHIIWDNHGATYSILGSHKLGQSTMKGSNPYLQIK